MWALCDGLTLCRPSCVELPWQTIARRSWLWHKQGSQHIVGNLQLKFTLVHPQKSTLRDTDLHDTLTLKRCVCLRYGLDYVLEVSNFLLNEQKKGKDYFRQNWPLLICLTKCWTQLIAKGNSILDGLDLPSQAKCLKPHWGSAYIRQWSIVAIPGERIIWETVKYINTELMTLAVNCTDLPWCMKRPGK